MDALNIDPFENTSEGDAPKSEEKSELDHWMMLVNPIDREISGPSFFAELEFLEIPDMMHTGLSETKIFFKRVLDKLCENFLGIVETYFSANSLTYRQGRIDFSPTVHSV